MLVDGAGMQETGGVVGASSSLLPTLLGPLLLVAVALCGGSAERTQETFTWLLDPSVTIDRKHKNGSLGINRTCKQK